MTGADRPAIWVIHVREAKRQAASLVAEFIPY